MNEFDISDITGVSDSKNFSIQNNYRFDALIRAIDFFSQKFNMETLIDFAGDFINEILTLNSSAVFVYDKSENCFTASKIRIYRNEIKKIPNTKKLQDIARLYGAIITKNFSPFFSEKFLDAYKPALLLPLIHNNELLGFIVTDGKVMGDFDEDDYSMAKALMLLFNNAFDRNFYVSELALSQKRVDKLSFELYAANKVSGILFNEIDRETLITTCLEAVSEVSGSRTTSLAVTDETVGVLSIKGFKDLRDCSVDCKVSYVELQDNPDVNVDKYILHVDRDIAALKNIFKNTEVFAKLDTEYIIIVIIDGVQSVVTLGKSGNVKYGQETLEVVHYLAEDFTRRYCSL